MGDERQQRDFDFSGSVDIQDLERDEDVKEQGTQLGIFKLTVAAEQP